MIYDILQQNATIPQALPPLQFNKTMKTSNELSLSNGSMWRKKWNTLQYFFLKDPMNKGALQAIVHGVAKEPDMP